jgi:hypothetical protein
MALYNSGMVEVYTNQVPYEEDVLRTNLYKLTEVAGLAATTLGIGVNYPTMVRGFPCVPVSPPGLSVVVGSNQTPDVIYSLQPLLATNFSVIPADTTPSHYQFMQGFNWGQVTLSTPAPTSVGDSVIHLVQVAFSTQDVNNVSRPYFNSVDPTMPIFNNNYDTRTNLAIVQIKHGVEAPSPTPPTPDAGFIGLYYVTVTYGQTSIVSGNIAKVSSVEGQPFITESLTEKAGPSTLAGYPTIAQLQTTNFVRAIGGGTANAITAAPSPAYTSLTQARVSVYITTTNTGATTLNLSSLGATAVRKKSQSGLIALTGGEITTGWYDFYYDGTYFELINPNTVSPSDLQTGVYNYAIAAGSVNAWTATFPSGGKTPTLITVEFPSGNTGSATLEVIGDSDGALPIIVSVAGGGDLYQLSGYEIANGTTHTFIKYNSPLAWYMLETNNPKRPYAQTSLATLFPISSTTESIVQYDTIVNDPYGMFSTNTYTATIPIAGNWRITTGNIAAGGGALYDYVYLNVNGTDVITLGLGTSTPQELSGVVDYVFNANDTVAISILNNGALTLDITGGTSGSIINGCYFQLQYLGPADLTVV